MRGGRPAPVVAYLRRAHWWLAALTAVAVAGAGYSVWGTGRDEDRRDRWVLESATVRNVFPRTDEIEVRYVHPVTGQELDVRVDVYRSTLPERDTTLELVVDPDDPDSVALPGDRPSTIAVVLPWALLVVVPLAMCAVRHWSVRRAERLITSAGASFAMTGAIAPPGRLGWRCELHLWPLDAEAGAPSMCRVPLLVTAGLPIGGPAFDVEVKGSPRPFGRVVARSGTVLFPSGAALIGRTRPRPARRGVPAPLPPEQAVAPPAIPSWFAAAGWPLGATAAAAGIALVIAGLSAEGALAARAAQDGAAVLARVVAAEETAGAVLVQYRMPGDAEGVRREGEAPADWPSEYTVGRLYPANVDPSQPGRLRFAREHYDARTPVVWALVPLAVCIGVVVRSWMQWRRIRRLARAGPWRSFEGWPVSRQPGVVSLVVPGTGQVPASVRIGRSLAAQLPGRVPSTVLVAGDPQPGGLLAVRIDDAVLPRALTGGAARSLTWW